MIRINKIAVYIFAVSLITGIACKKDRNNMPPPDTFDTAGIYQQNDQMARPAINTVFVGADRKNEFNTTIPSAMSMAFKADFLAKLSGFGYTQNALGQSADAFAGLLVADVLNAKLNGKTTFFDGTNVLTGRDLPDDVIDTELLLLFGGPSGTSNPGLTSDNVSSNDKPFLTSFPYMASPF